MHNELVARQNHEGNQAMLALDLAPAPVAGIAHRAIAPALADQLNEASGRVFSEHLQRIRG